MTYTSASAHKQIKLWTEERDALIQKEREICSYTYQAGEEPVIEKYDFVNTQCRIAEYNNKIADLRHAVNLFNTTTVLPGLGFTIDEALVRMSMLNDQKNRLSRMKDIREKTRQTNYKGISEFTERNFNIDDCEALYQKVCNELIQIQLSIDKTNLTEQFDVPDED